MADNEEPDYIFLECNCDHSFEKTDDNSRWINKIDGGVTLPENSTLSVQYAGINVLGSGGDVIELKHEKIGESEIYKYNNTTEEYEKVKYDVYDNEVTLQIEFYKNQDGLYNYQMPMPDHGFNTNVDEEWWSALDNTKGFDEIQYGISTSTFKSKFNYAFPIDNKRYTILEMNPNTDYTNPTFGEYFGREGTLGTYYRDIANFEYSIYHNEVKIQVDTGFISPSSIAEQISQQLDKHSEPKIKEMECFQDNENMSTAWPSESVTVQGGLTCETNTFKLFQCATRRTYYQYAAVGFNAQDLPYRNNNAEVIQYQKNFKHIGCYNPNIFLTGRNIQYDINYHNKQEQFLILNKIDTSSITEAQILREDLFTNIPYDKNILSQFNDLFKFIRADDQMYETKPAKQTASTSENSVFLHTEPQLKTYADLTTYKKTPFGIDFTKIGNAINYNFTNAIYLDWDADAEQDFSNSLAYGVFKPWRASDGTIYTLFRARLYVEKKKDSDPAQFYFPYYTVDTRTTFGSELAEGYEAFNQSNFPIATNNYTRIGWDRHFSAHGNQCILLYNGLGNVSQLVVEATPEKGTLDEAAKILENSFIKTGTENNPEPTIYMYDTGNDQIYLGADSFLFNFDNTESRFTMSQLHTSRKQFNTALSGFDPSIWQGVEKDASGIPKIFYEDRLVNGNKSVQFPLDANPNSNQGIYEISPTELNTSTIEVYNSYENVKTNTIFDSNCGIYFGSFGVDDKTYKNSLWDILGFSQGQTKTYMTQPPNLQEILYRSNRFLNAGVNLNQSDKYPFTTNAQINSNEIISWKTNPFNLSYFNTLGIPNNMRVITYNSSGKNFDFEYQVRPYQVIQNQISTLMFGERLPRKTKIPFYQVRSDILPTIKYIGGNNNTSGRLPVLSLVNKSFSGTDYYVNQGDNSMEFIITKRITINNITTEIYDSNGVPALLDPHSSVIYKIQVPYNPPQITPFATSLEYTTAMNLEKQKKKKNKK